MYQANVLEIFIASPSDVVTERDIAEMVIQEWNAIHSKNNKTILLPIRWEKNVHSDFSADPQDVVNEQVLKNADILVAIFWSKIGTPTKHYESGTVEELRLHIEAKKPAIVLFSKENLSQDYNREQFEQLLDFKQWCQTRGVYFEYNGASNFKELIRNQLSLVLNKNFFGKDTNFYHTPNITTKISRSKTDALDFVKNIPLFQQSNTNLEKYLEKIGDYRRDKISDFLNDAGLLTIQHTLGGNAVMTIQPRLSNMTTEDVQLFQEDILAGDYDHLL